MNVNQMNQSKKKFTGFTSLFKNQLAEKKPLKSKQPFTGFSEFYKNLKEHDHDDDYDSEYDPFPRPKKREKIIEPELPADLHFKPQNYFTWCKERTKEAYERYVVPDLPKDEDVESIKTTWLMRDMKKSSKKYEDYRKYYDQSERDNLSQIQDVNPWFYNMLENWKKGPEKNCKPETDVPAISEGLYNVYQKLNAREMLKLHDERSRNVNTYPNELQLKFLNHRIKRFLQQTDHENLETSSQVTSFEMTQNHPQLQFNVLRNTENKDLIDYFNRVVKPKKEIQFKSEEFKSWYSRMSLEYDRRYRNLLELNMTPEPQDFNAWLLHQTEEINRSSNEFLKDFYKSENSKSKTHKKDKKCERNLSDFNSLKNLSNNIHSNLSSCRSMFVRQM